MRGFVLRRVAWAGVVFLALTLYTYVLFFIIPGNSEAFARGYHRDGDATLPESVGIEGDSLLAEYGSFVSHVVQGDLGVSQRTREPVTEVIARAAPVTISLVLGGALVWLLVAVPIGIVSALRPRSLLDRAGMIFVLVGVAAHPVWIALMLGYAFGFKLGWTPIGGYCPVFTPSATCGGPVQWAYHLLLPWIAFAAVFAAIYARMIRASILEIYHSDHVRTARALGMSEPRILRTQVARIALLPLVTMLGMDIGIAFGGAIFIEPTFGLPGVGKLLVASVGGRDLAVVLGIVVFVVTTILLINLIVDLLYPLLDPRIDYGSSHSANARSNWLRGRAPTTVALGTPPSNSITVGNERTP
jgi:peptide/nickel transport system permease protein